MPKQLRTDFPVNSKVISRECLYCNSVFFSNKPFAKYCSDKCRVYYNSGGKKAMPGAMPGTRQEALNAIRQAIEEKPMEFNHTAEEIRNLNRELPEPPLPVLKPLRQFLEEYANSGHRVLHTLLSDHILQEKRANKGYLGMGAMERAVKEAGFVLQPEPLRRGEDGRPAPDWNKEWCMIGKPKESPTV